MSSKRETPLEVFLNRHDDAAWRETLVTLLPSIHEVDAVGLDLCPFLDASKRSPHGGFSCMIYSDRPLACRAYPVTDSGI